MKQKVTIKVQMGNESCRKKAMEIASMTKGVSSVAIQGNEKDQLVVTGEDVDTVCLGKLLRKKFCSVTVLTVEEVKPKPPEKKDDKDKTRCTTISIIPPSCFRCHSSNCHGACKPTSCLRCRSHNCHGNCRTCLRCESPKCQGTCKSCSRCESYKCDGGCKPCFRCGSPKCRGFCRPCSRCENYRCRGDCTSSSSSSSCFQPPCFNRCPPWNPCSSCCVKPGPCRSPCGGDFQFYIYLFVVIVVVIFVYAKCGKSEEKKWCCCGK